MKMSYPTTLVATAAFLASMNAQAQTTQPPRAILPQSNVTTTDNVVQMTRVPVVTSTGAVFYRDIRIEFNVSAAGAVTLKPGFPRVVASAPIIPVTFSPGRYKYNGYIFNLRQAGVATGGRTTWNLTETTYYNFQATWTTGPILNHPIVGLRLAAARVTNPTLAYGSIGYNAMNSTLDDGDLFGAQALPDTIVFYDFTGDSGDASQPVEYIILERCPDTGAC
jgi:hypothetical protein